MAANRDLQRIHVLPHFQAPLREVSIDAGPSDRRCSGPFRLFLYCCAGIDRKADTGPTEAKREKKS
jgi:hypothetical protein